MIFSSFVTKDLPPSIITRLKKIADSAKKAMAEKLALANATAILPVPPPSPVAVIGAGSGTGRDLPPPPFLYSDKNNKNIDDINTMEVEAGESEGGNPIFLHIL
jgi:hypothetical protein